MTADDVSREPAGGSQQCHIPNHSGYCYAHRDYHHDGPPRSDQPVYGGWARAEALAAGHPDWMNVKQWPLTEGPFGG